MRLKTPSSAGIGCCLIALAAIFGPMAPMANAQETSIMPITQAAENNDMATLRSLIAAGADLEARDDQGRTALLIATHRNAIAAAAALIDAGADVNARDHIGDSAFLYAGAEGRLEILRLTLKAGADLASTNRYGGTALIPAAHHGHAETVRELLATDIPIDHVNNLGWTALLEAVILGDGGKAHTEIVRLLVQAGASVNIADRDGVTPLQHAERSGYREIVQILSDPSLRP